MEAVLAQQLTNTLSPDAAQRRAAEQQLGTMEAQPGFAIALLQLVQAHCAPNAPPQSLQLRSAGAIYFKNFVKRGWSDEDNQADGKENACVPAAAAARRVARARSRARSEILRLARSARSCFVPRARAAASPRPTATRSRGTWSG